MKWLKLLLLVLGMLFVVVFLRTWYFSSVSNEAPQEARHQTLAMNESEAVGHFAQSIRFKTISSENPTDDYNDQFDQLQAFLKRVYPQVFSTLKVTTVGKHGLLMKWQGSDASQQPVLFMAHQDVVPIAPGTEGTWQHAPFAGVIQDGYVWGRGALDCKAALTALFETTTLLIKHHFTPQRTIYFYFGDDEEKNGGTPVLARELLEKQGIRFAFVIDEAGFIVDGLFPQVQGPVALISVAEKGWLNLQLAVNAEGGHSSMPPKVTAIGSVSQAIVDVLKQPLPARFDGVTRQLFEILSQRMSFADRLVLDNVWLFKPYITYTLTQQSFTNALVRTTQAPTIFNAGIKSNVLPSNASAIINFRIAPGDTVASVTDHVKAAINNPLVTMTQLVGWNPSPIASVTAPGYQLLTQTIKRIYGNDIMIAPWVVTGATDSRFFTPIADNVYRFFPIAVKKQDIPRFHGIDERYAERDYVNMIRFYYELLAAN